MDSAKHAKSVYRFTPGQLEITFLCLSFLQNQTYVDCKGFPGYKQVSVPGL